MKKGLTLLQVRNNCCNIIVAAFFVKFIKVLNLSDDIIYDKYYQVYYRGGFSMEIKNYLNAVNAYNKTKFERSKASAVSSTSAVKTLIRLNFLQAKLILSKD